MFQISKKDRKANNKVVLLLLKLKLLKIIKTLLKKENNIIKSCKLKTLHLIKVFISSFKTILIKKLEYIKNLFNSLLLINNLELKK